jgi:hypothetical protein
MAGGASERSWTPWRVAAFALLMAVFVGGVVMVLRFTDEDDDERLSTSAWAPPANYAVVETVKIDDDAYIRLWADQAVGSVCYVAEEANAAGEHQSDSSSACSPPDREWSWSRGQGVIVLQVPFPEAGEVVVTSPDGARIGPLPVHHQLVMMKDYWLHEPVELTAQARGSKREDLGSPEVIPLAPV